MSDAAPLAASRFDDIAAQGGRLPPGGRGDAAVAVEGVVLRRKTLSRFLCLVTLGEVDGDDAEAAGAFNENTRRTLTVALERRMLNATTEAGAAPVLVRDAAGVCEIGAAVRAVGVVERTGKGQVAVAGMRVPTLLAAPEGEAAHVTSGGAPRGPCRAQWDLVVKGLGSGCPKQDTCEYEHDERALRDRAAQLGVRVHDQGGIVGAPDALSAASHADKKYRFEAFATWLGEYFGAELLRRGPVIDIAGGKGHLGVWLHRKHAVSTVVVDPANHDRDRKSQARLRKHCVTKVVTHITSAAAVEDPVLRAHLESASVIVGLHPDEATDLVVDLALAFNKPFAVVPCCVFPTLFPHRQLRAVGAQGAPPVAQPVVSTDDLLAYLEQEARGRNVATNRSTLPIRGRNIVLHAE